MTEIDDLSNVLARAWSDGYQAGVGDEERCTHPPNEARWRRLVYFLSRGHMHIRWPWEKCYLYSTDNPYEESE